MPSSNEIRDVKFTTTMNGYKRDEVDELLDAIEADYTRFEAENAKLRAAVSNLTNELEEAKREQTSIQTVLVSAQKLADEIVAKAKAEAAQIVSESKSKTDLAEQKAKDAIIEIENQAVENRKAAEEEIAKMKKDALATSEAIITSAKDSVARQQIQFEAIKSEVSQFKEQIKALYKEHIELLTKIPDEVTGAPIEAAAAMEQILAEARAAAAAGAAVPAAEKTEAEPAAEEAPAEMQEPAEETKPEEVPESAQETGGFKINLPSDANEEDEEDDEEDDDEDEEDRRGFGSSFFHRRG